MFPDIVKCIFRYSLYLFENVWVIKHYIILCILTLLYCVVDIVIFKRLFLIKIFLMYVLYFCKLFNTFIKIKHFLKKCICFNNFIIIFFKKILDSKIYIKIENKIKNALFNSNFFEICLIVYFAF